MTNQFTDEFERRLRAVLALRAQAPLPADIPVEMYAIGGADIEGNPIPRELEIRTTAHPYAAWSYEEPGAWGKLLADLEAVGEPAARPLTRQESGLLAKLNDEGGQHLAATFTYPLSVLAERGLIQEHGLLWYITPAGRAAVEDLRRSGDETDQVHQDPRVDRITRQGRKNGVDPNAFTSAPRRALDVIAPLSPEESDLLVMLADKARPRLDSAQLALAAALAERGRGLTYLRGDYWSLTVFGLDVAAEIKAAAEPASPPIAFVRAERLAGPGVSQWWAWDELGTKYILTFIHGVGTVCTARLGADWPPVRQFEHGTSRQITLEAFAEHAGIDVSRIPEDQRR